MVDFLKVPRGRTSHFLRSIGQAGQRRMAYLAAGTALFYDEMRKGIKSNFIAFK